MNRLREWTDVKKEIRLIEKLEEVMIKEAKVIHDKHEQYGEYFYMLATAVVRYLRIANEKKGISCEKKKKSKGKVDK